LKPNERRARTSLLKARKREQVIIAKDMGTVIISGSSDIL